MSVETIINQRQCQAEAMPVGNLKAVVSAYLGLLAGLAIFVATAEPALAAAAPSWSHYPTCRALWQAIHRLPPQTPVMDWPELIHMPGLSHPDWKPASVDDALHVLRVQQDTFYPPRSDPKISDREWAKTYDVAKENLQNNTLKGYRAKIDFHENIGILTILRADLKWINQGYLFGESMSKKNSTSPQEYSALIIESSDRFKTVSDMVIHPLDYSKIIIVYGRPYIIFLPDGSIASLVFDQHGAIVGDECVWDLTKKWLRIRRMSPKKIR